MTGRNKREVEPEPEPAIDKLSPDEQAELKRLLAKLGGD